jgi:hypothetical protein
MKRDDAQALRETMACALVALFRMHPAPSTLERIFRNVLSESGPTCGEGSPGALPATQHLLAELEAVLRENKKEKRTHAQSHVAFRDAVRVRPITTNRATPSRSRDTAAGS